MTSKKYSKADQVQEQDQNVPDWKESFQKMREGSKPEQRSVPGRRGPFPAPVQQEAAKVIQLDFWEDGKRAAANAVLRSALFPALGRGKRKFLKEEKLESVAGVTVFFTGEQFDQSDFDVYLEVINFAKPFPLGTPVRFSARGMLKALGRSTGGKDHKWLHSVLIRLSGGVIDATDHKKRYFGQLVHGGIKDEITDEYEITINPKFAVLFGFGMWSTIDVEQRRALGRNATAKALHNYYSSHVQPTMHTYDRLTRLAGLTAKHKGVVKSRLIKAHEALKEVGFLSDFEATANGIKAEIIPTLAQKKYLMKKIRKAKK